MLASNLSPTIANFTKLVLPQPQTKDRIAATVAQRARELGASLFDGADAQRTEWLMAGWTHVQMPMGAALFARARESAEKRGFAAPSMCVPPLRSYVAKGALMSDPTVELERFLFVLLTAPFDPVIIMQSSHNQITLYPFGEAFPDLALRAAHHLTVTERQILTCLCAFAPAAFGETSVSARETTLRSFKFAQAFGERINRLEMVRATCIGALRAQSARTYQLCKVMIVAAVQQLIFDLATVCGPSVVSLCDTLASEQLLLYVRGVKYADLHHDAVVPSPKSTKCAFPESAVYARQHHITLME